MKFEISKKVLVDALRRSADVATKGLKSEYDKAFRVTIHAQKDRVIFTTSNGFLSSRLEVTEITDKTISVSEEGVVTADVKRMKAIVNALGGKRNALIEVMTDDQNGLNLRDLSAKRKKARIEQDLYVKHTESISRPREPQLAAVMDVDLFRRAVCGLGKYVSTLGYKVRYHMLCMHFFNDRTNFVCGDGMRFAVMMHDSPLAENVNNPDGEKFIIPVEQANIISNVIDMDGVEKVELLYKDEQTLFINPIGSGMQLCLKGIPNEKYIAYERHAFRTGDAQDIIDVDTQELREGMALVESLRNKENEKEDGKYHTFKFEASQDTPLLIRVDEHGLKCEFECETVNFYDLKDNPAFRSQYAFLYVDEIAKAAGEHPTVRFYCIDENTVIITEPLTLEDASEGIPSRKPVGDRIVFFYTSVRDENES